MIDWSVIQDLSTFFKNSMSMRKIFLVRTIHLKSIEIAIILKLMTRHKFHGDINFTI